MKFIPPEIQEIIYQYKEEMESLDNISDEEKTKILDYYTQYNEKNKSKEKITLDELKEKLQYWNEADVEKRTQNKNDFNSVILRTTNEIDALKEIPLDSQKTIVQEYENPDSNLDFTFCLFFVVEIKA